VSFLSEANVAENVLALCRSLNENSETAIALDTSLTHSLIFDSMKLVQFFAGVEALYPGVALEDWFIEHSPGWPGHPSQCRFLPDAISRSPGRKRLKPAPIFAN
jgi:hypothetical protein